MTRGRRSLCSWPDSVDFERCPKIVRYPRYVRRADKGIAMAKCSIGWTGLFLVSTLCVLSLFLGEPAQADSAFADLPPPGRLVEFDGYRLHINCTGAGTPTVILEEGAGGGSLNWTWIQRKIAT